MHFFYSSHFFSLSLVKKLVHYHHYCYKFSFTLHEPMLSHSVIVYYNVMYTFFWWAVLSSWRQKLNLNVVFFWFKQVFSFIVWCDVSNCNTRRGWKSIQENLLSNFHNTWNQMVRLCFFPHLFTSIEDRYGLVAATFYAFKRFTNVTNMRKNMRKTSKNQTN